MTDPDLKQIAQLIAASMAAHAALLAHVDTMVASVGELGDHGIRSVVPSLLAKAAEMQQLQSQADCYRELLPTIVADALSAEQGGDVSEARALMTRAFLSARLASNMHETSAAIYLALAKILEARAMCVEEPSPS